MKANSGILILLAVFILSYAEKVKGNPPTAEQIDKMISAASKEPVTTIDITFYKHTIRPKKSIEEIRQMFERALENPKRPKQKLSPTDLEQYNRNVQLNVERMVKEQEVGSKTKERIRIDGYYQRIDHVSGRPEMVLLKGTPHEDHRPEVVLGPNTPYNMTYINLGDKNKGDYRSLTYYHDSKSVMIQNKRTWAKSSIIADLASLSSYFQMLLGANEGKLLEPVYVPDANMNEELSKTGLVANVLRVTINPDPNSPNERDRIEIKLDEYPRGTVMICDREDYSHVYYTEVCNPVTGKPLYIRQCSNFDDQGFPRNATIMKYDVNGKLEEKEVYIFERVELAPVIPDEVFAFNPPADYEIIETDSKGNIKVIREKGGIDGAMWKLQKAFNAKDIETLNGMLGHEIWQIRLNALQVLEMLLDKQPDELKNAAMILKDDDNQSVRKEAGKILKRLESINLSALSDKK